MKTIKSILTLAVAVTALCFIDSAANAQNIGSEFVVSATTAALASATTNQVIPVHVYPASGLDFVCTGVDVSVISGTISNTAPTLELLGAATGSTPLLSAAVLLTGTSVGYATHIAALSANLPLLVTGTAGSTLSVLVSTTGTSSTAHTDLISVKGYYINPTTGGL